MLDVLMTVGRWIETALEALDALRGWRLLACIAVALAVAKGLLVFGLLPGSGALPLFLLVGTILGLLWEGSRAIADWTGTS